MSISTTEFGAYRALEYLSRIRPTAASLEQAILATSSKPDLPVRVQSVWFAVAGDFARNGGEGIPALLEPIYGSDLAHICHESFRNANLTPGLAEAVESYASSLSNRP